MHPAQRRHPPPRLRTPTRPLPPRAGDFRGVQHPCSKRDVPLPDAACYPSPLTPRVRGDQGGRERVRGRGNTAHPNASNTEFAQTFCPPPHAGDQGETAAGSAEPAEAQHARRTRMHRTVMVPREPDGRRTAEATTREMNYCSPYTTPRQAVGCAERRAPARASPDSWRCRLAHRRGWQQ